MCSSVGKNLLSDLRTIDAVAIANGQRRKNEKNRAADERCRNRNVIQEQSSKCRSQHDRKLNRRDHQSAAAFRFVTDSFREPRGPRYRNRGVESAPSDKRERDWPKDVPDREEADRHG